MYNTVTVESGVVSAVSVVVSVAESVVVSSLLMCVVAVAESVVVSWLLMSVVVSVLATDVVVWLIEFVWGDSFVVFAGEEASASEDCVVTVLFTEAGSALE